ncbi:tRNA uridine-5-carboxymethylaminomethyl(34) synthesis enzyme MnmG [candidate division WOR-3 bacterium]|uniref:tRNA uridine 5-carboxymethylaminomethyl modification enzyme MnmG n=1 Tax=candidate division WOR-3 bacterium TaxID=2052148 RepID=A0A9D5K849_UNCW3|nr:tRNA uridine-5-carboxymethylaminomethyl(34) synthesis enzyme MnmG [candidate division WOR-3 bacterium]MBD3364043.1 tRNA uridine-5-carboxymethylaminomethyl(34) synthesis enzyme MnmG [candidate division WOR-3 bacterium]
MTGHYDVIVVGGGHAGIEASHAAAKMGCRTLLITASIERIGEMSCNPAIGGLGKSQLVREIDALGGLQGRLADRGGIHFRRLNRSKGPAVQSTRIQCDKAVYREFARRVLEETANLAIWQDKVEGLYIEGERVAGIDARGAGRIRAHTVILTPGTFLAGMLHIGDRSFSGGRLGDAPSNSLAKTLRVLGFKLGRFKTGTPPRIDGRTLNTEKMESQSGEEPPLGISFFTRRKLRNQVECYLTRTTSVVHEIVKENLDRSPLYAGKIKGTGVRYCPSIEDKVVKFADAESHRIFIEPEGLSTREVYPNGISTSLPLDAQIEMVHAVPGLENTEFTRPGYAVEHDYVQPTQLFAWLETKMIRDLFFAGQINGTTGYEEAAAQGLIAGINAARRVKGIDPFILGRDSAYIGVLIDDLVTKGTNEPYRMFTSRVEYRLLLREDNAHARLSGIGRRIGLLRAKDFRKVEAVETATSATMDRLVKIKPALSRINKVMEAKGIKPLTQKVSLNDLLKRPELHITDLEGLDKALTELAPVVKERVEIETKYSGYIARTLEEIERFHRIEKVKIPEDVTFHDIPGLSNEVIEKLDDIHPSTLGQASRISGVTPVALLAMFRYFKGGDPDEKKPEA